MGVCGGSGGGGRKGEEEEGRVRLTSRYLARDRKKPRIASMNSSSVFSCGEGRGKEKKGKRGRGKGLKEEGGGGKRQRDDGHLVFRFFALPFTEYSKYTSQVTPYPEVLIQHSGQHGDDGVLPQGM